MFFDAPVQETLDQADRAMVAAIAAAGCRIDQEEFFAEFKARIHEYYHDRDTEFIEYTSEHILRRVLARFGYPSADNALVRGALNALYTITQAHWQPEADALPTLQQLQAAGLRMGLISNASDAPDVEELIDKGRFRPYFDQILISAAIGYRKPHPRMFELALKHFRVEPQEALMVGDKLGADILGANDLGIQTAWITRRIDPLAEQNKHPDIHPTFRLDNLNQLIDILHLNSAVQA